MYRPEIYHPMIVHFPIALAFLSTLLYILYIATRREFYLQAVSWSVPLGALSAAVAVAAGKIAERSAVHNEAAHEILVKYHQPLGFAVLAALLLLTAWGFAVRWKFSGANLAAYAAALLLTAALVAATGHYGGAIVYEHGMGVRPALLKESRHTHPSGGGHHEDHNEDKEHEEDQGHEHEGMKNHDMPQDDDAGDAHEHHDDEHEHEH